ncbi:MAG: DUF6163 family protein [Pseudomonadota bacterium]
MKTNTVSRAGFVSQVNYLMLLLRVVSLVLLAFSASYWAKLTGISDGNIRFDTMSSPWKVAATSLVVLLPVASLGLWGAWRWGVVVWIIVMIIEVTMYGFYPAIFGQANIVLLFHAIAITVYLMVLAINMYVERRGSEDG